MEQQKGLSLRSIRATVDVAETALHHQQLQAQRHGPLTTMVVTCDARGNRRAKLKVNGS